MSQIIMIKYDFLNDPKKHHLIAVSQLSAFIIIIRVICVPLHLMAK